MELIVQDLFKKYGKNEVLKGCNYKFSSGKIIGLLGKNGSGKTTFFNIVNQELKFELGNLMIEEDGVVRSLKKEDVGMLHSEYFLPEYLTGYEFVKFLCEVHEDKKPLSIEEYFNLVSFDLQDQHKMIRDYSDGMKSKISIIPLLISKPKIILLDEPLTAIDVVSSIQIKKIFLKLSENHIIILSTHILELAKDICDEIVILKEGLMNELKLKENFETEVYEALRGD